MMLRHETAGPAGKELNALASAIGWLAALGDRAGDLADSRLQLDTTAPNWPNLDADTRELYAEDLIDLLNLEEQMPPREGLWAKYLSAESYAELHDAVTHYHGTLPFSETERNWLFAAYRETEELPVVEKQQAEIPSMGRLQVVTGAELVRRWWAWRRGAEEFEGSGAYERSQVALRGLQALVGERR